MKDRIQPRTNCCLQPLLSHLAQVPVLQRMVLEVSTVKTTSSPPKNKILSWPLKHLLARATQACVSLLPESQQVGTSFSLGCTEGTSDTHRLWLQSQAMAPAPTAPFGLNGHQARAFQGGQKAGVTGVRCVRPPVVVSK